ncbi:MAG: nitrate- and nitrite sensing domain-containing protein, partial [Gallionellaceae bacterium]|nr:nitrate- and nitrite sensing domain-containing protein [Gallionellaceae bacterium]
MNLSKLHFKTKLVLMLIPALLGLLFFSSNVLLDRYKSMTLLSDLEVMMAFADQSSEVIHEVQVERGLSAGFLASRGAKFSEALKSQRESTDKKISGLNTFINDKRVAGMLAGYGAGPEIAETRSQLEKVAKLRAGISDFSIAPGASFAGYTALVDALIDNVQHVVVTSNNSDIAMETTAYLAFLKEKEQMGRERATLNGVFTVNHFERDTYARLLTIMAAQDIYARTFKYYASEKMMQLRREIDGSDAAHEVDAMRKVALEKYQEGNFGIEPSRWFATISKKINAMKVVEDKTSQYLGQHSAELANHAR